ncbi:Rieske 2Fe-2S domain-containing protein [Paraburkholderia sp. LEh10]|uniref:aromatic ring-hydroxylating oxygenase subunit alpha n=1 Tax=Paraburkholderia sp. LEh10 TaxID=2821353 RepID=UPI001AEAC4D4|nr:SRPBCC family protein [Paraburkholderia sp. LEh10]MBP0590409.1 Rieske 2Fe-2S domain-containing protein [Paraburkholderia sp. LEh10]
METEKLEQVEAQIKWESSTRVPYQIYTSSEIFKAELNTIFHGRSWNFVGLEAEIPNKGDFRRGWVGNRAVIIVRTKDGIVVLENRCAHRGVEFCKQPGGNAKVFTCPYHQWNYNLDGSLRGVAYRRGIDGKGGMPEDFDLKDFGLTRLNVATRNGVIFASFAPDMEPLEEFLGPSVLRYFDRAFDGRELKILGRHRQRIPGNWKLMFENIKDPYHAALLHVFFISSGLIRADQPGRAIMDDTGRHSVHCSDKPSVDTAGEETRKMATYRADLKLNDQKLFEKVPEFPGTEAAVIMTIWPNLILQQNMSCLATRQIVPAAPGEFELVWTHFGYASDDDETTERRLRQAALFGPAGLVSVDDGEIIEFAQNGMKSHPKHSTLIEMGGRDVEDADHMITEVAIRKFYQYYRDVMGMAR